MPQPRMDREPYKTIAEEILGALGRAKKPMTFEEMRDAAGKRVPSLTVGRLSWYAKSVQLDLEREGKLERLAEQPLRWKLPDGPLRNLRQSYRMKASARDVWAMLVDAKKIAEWSGAPATMGAKVGAAFSLWGDDIFGENLEVVPPRKLVQQWRVKGWTKPSTVTFNLRERKDGETIETDVELVHTSIPAKELDEIASGWDAYYLGAIKAQFAAKKKAKSGKVM